MYYDKFIYYFITSDGWEEEARLYGKDRFLKISKREDEFEEQKKIKVLFSQTVPFKWDVTINVI